jgi:hypothetical protein
MNRREALDQAAATILAQVRDIEKFCGLLDDAGLGRLSAAVRVRRSISPADVDQPALGRPSARLWSSQADRVIAGPK